VLLGAPTANRVRQQADEALVKNWLGPTAKSSSPYSHDIAVGVHVAIIEVHLGRGRRNRAIGKETVEGVAL